MPGGKTIVYCEDPHGLVDALFADAEAEAISSEVIWVPSSPHGIVQALVGADEHWSLAQSFNVDVHHDLGSTPVKRCTAIADGLSNLPPDEVPVVPSKPVVQPESPPAKSRSATKGIRRSNGDRKAAKARRDKRDSNRAAAARSRARAKQSWQDNVEKIKARFPGFAVEDPIDLFQSDMTTHLKFAPIQKSYRQACRDIKNMEQERDRTVGRKPKNNVSAKICRYRQTAGIKLLTAMLEQCQKQSIPRRP